MPCSVVEIDVETESNEMGSGFCPWQTPMQIATHMKFECTGERRLDCGAVHLAIALCAMTVAGREKGALVPYREIDDAAGSQFLAIEITAELARLLAALTSELLGRGDTKLPEEWPQRNAQPRWQDTGVAFGIERDVDDALIGKRIRQSAAIGPEQIVAPVLSKLDIKNPHFQHIADCRSADMDRSGQNMIAHASGRGFMNGLQLRQWFETARRRRHPFRVAGDTLNGNAIAGIDFKHRRKRTVPITPMDGLRA